MHLPSNSFSDILLPFERMFDTSRNYKQWQKKQLQTMRDEDMFQICQSLQYLQSGMNQLYLKKKNIEEMLCLLT